MLQKKNLRTITVFKKRVGGGVPARYDHDHRFNGFFFYAFPKVVKKAPANFPQKNKGFINYVFCRNLAVRNPAGTRLDFSSLVNK